MSREEEAEREEGKPGREREAITVFQLDRTRSIIMPAGGRLVPHPRGEIERRAAERERERSRFIQTLSHSVRLAKTRLSILARPCVHRSPPPSFLLLLPRFYLFRFLPPVSGSILPPFFVPGPRLYLPTNVPTRFLLLVPGCWRM